METTIVPSKADRARFRKWRRGNTYRIKHNHVMRFVRLGWINCRLDRFGACAATTWFVTPEGQKQLA